MDSRTRLVSDTSAVGISQSLRWSARLCNQPCNLRRKLSEDRNASWQCILHEQARRDPTEDRQCYPDQASQPLCAIAAELIVLELRQLSRAEHHVVTHQQRRIDFGIAMLVGVEIEHELPDRALQPREALLQHDEARTGQFRGGLEIHIAERAAEIVMRLWRKTVFAALAEHVTLHVAVLVDAIGHVVERADSGIAASSLLSSSSAAFAAASSSGIVVLSSATSAISFAARASSLAFLASPISFERRVAPRLRLLGRPGSRHGASRRSRAAMPTTAQARAVSVRRRRLAGCRGSL